MRIKDLLKKSIEDNIVDKDAVIKNLKAAAARQGTGAATERSAPVSGRSVFGFRRAALVLAALSVVIVSAIGMALLVGNNPNNHDVAYSTNKCDEPAQLLPELNLDFALDENDDIYGGKAIIGKTEFEDIVSRFVLGSGTDSGITLIPLSDEELEFFKGFAVDLMFFQDIKFGRVYKASADIESNGYYPAANSRFSDLDGLREFLYEFLTPERAGEIYTRLISGEIPLYLENEEGLYVNSIVSDKVIKEIFPEHSYIISESDEELIIAAKLTSAKNGKEFYRSFRFVKTENGLLYDYNP